MKFRDVSGRFWSGQSRPARGAWVEIEAINETIQTGKGRAPQGARGLKSRPSQPSSLTDTVAPRKGRVG